MAIAGNFAVRGDTFIPIRVHASAIAQAMMRGVIATHISGAINPRQQTARLCPHARAVLDSTCVQAGG